MRTKLGSPEIDPDTHRLAQASNQEISLIIQSDLSEDESIGNQYLLFILPFGGISAGGAKHIITNSAFEELAFLGFSPKLTDKPFGKAVVLHIEDIDLTAYDYFLMRKIVCKIKLRGQLFNDRGELSYTNYKETRKSWYKKFAFREELEYSFSKTAREAVSELLKDLMHVPQAR